MTSDSLSLSIGYKLDKLPFILSYIKGNNLTPDHIRVNKKRETINIYIEDRHYIDQFKTIERLIVKRSPSLTPMISYDVAMLYMTLFGVRQVESISVSCSFNTSQKKFLAHLLQFLIGTNLIPNSRNNLIIPNIKDFIAINLSRLDISVGSELLNYLTEAELNKLQIGRPKKMMKVKI
ncbi:hypothetical protein [Escherichia coli]|uniref:hypothetical protein n=1 Tax=Escherichia coli TaxID=562 RepID=UPI002FEEF7CD